MESRQKGAKGKCHVRIHNLTAEVELGEKSHKFGF